MAGIPVGTVAILIAGALSIGFIWGSLSGNKGKSTGSIGFFGGGASSPENFTPAAQRVLAMAREEADRFNHNFVGTEHALLGLIKHGKGVAFNVLKKIGLDLDMLRLEIEKLMGTGPDRRFLATGPEQKIVGDNPYTPRLKKALTLAAKEAKALNHTYVGTEHILLGLLREGDGVAARVLKNMNVDMEQTRLEILKELDPNFNS